MDKSDQFTIASLLKTCWQGNVDKLRCCYIIVIYSKKWNDCFTTCDYHSIRRLWVAQAVFCLTTRLVVRSFRPIPVTSYWAHPDLVIITIMFKSENLNTVEKGTGHPTLLYRWLSMMSVYSLGTTPRFRFIDTVLCTWRNRIKLGLETTSSEQEWINDYSLIKFEIHHA